MNSKAADNAHHRNRLRAEKRFRFYGRCALGLAIVMLVVLLGSLLSRGYKGFEQPQILLPITFNAAELGVTGNDVTGIPPSAYQHLVQSSLKSLYPDVTGHDALKELYGLVSDNDGVHLKSELEHHPELLNQIINLWIPASSDADMYLEGAVSEKTPEAERNISDRQMRWINGLKEKGAVRIAFDYNFFTRGNSRSSEQAGFLGAILGSAFTLLTCLFVAFPLGVMTAVYLEEFARKGKWVDLIEVNINNLAAVPSIVFGLLGLAVFINAFGFPRSAPLVGGLTLALMILPVIIITTRASLSAIPGSIRDAARALGATPVQVVWHHVLPLSMPGIMTGTILGMARAIGETAPLLMIGMVAFVADLPTGFTSSATVMPVQIYLWASSAEGGYAEKTAAGILVLLVLLLAMNALAIILRKRFEVRW